jgi:hypothetical protein
LVAITFPGVVRAKKPASVGDVRFARYCTAFRALFCAQTLSVETTDVPKRKKYLIFMKFWWTHKGSNLGPLPCEGNALPLSYASGIFVQNQGPESGA